jgi:anti-anti-sigma factor
MPLRITEKECAYGAHGKTERSHDCETLLKVEGSLYLEDAELLERVCRDVGEQTGHRLILDLADLSFLDSDSASVLCRLKREQNVSLEGLHLFIAKVIELTEAEAMVSEYLAAANQTECEREFHNDTDRSGRIQQRVAATPKRNI